MYIVTLVLATQRHQYKEPMRVFKDVLPALHAMLSRQNSFVDFVKCYSGAFLGGGGEGGDVSTPHTPAPIVSVVLNVLP